MNTTFQKFVAEKAQTTLSEYEAELQIAQANLDVVVAQFEAAGRPAWTQLHKDVLNARRAVSLLEHRIINQSRDLAKLVK